MRPQVWSLYACCPDSIVKTSRAKNSYSAKPENHFGFRVGRAVRCEGQAAERTGQAQYRALSSRLHVSAFSRGASKLEVAICDLKICPRWTTAPTICIHRTRRNYGGNCAEHQAGD